MRSYPNNSPQAAARIVALAMLADGQVCKAEIDVRRHALGEGNELVGCVPDRPSIAGQTIESFATGPM